MPRRPSCKWADVAYWALWSVAVVLYLVWPLTHLEAYGWSNDEGLYVQRAALANAGYPLYTEISLNKPPLFIWILQLAFQMAGRTLAVARLTTLCLTLLGFVALGALVSRLWGRWAGLVSVLVLLGLPEVPARAHAVMSDLPAMACALLALGAAVSFRRSGRRTWIALSGAAYAGALLIHPLLIYTAPPLAVILLSRGLDQATDRHARRTGRLDLVVFLGVVFGLGLLVLAAIDWHAFFTWVVWRNRGPADINVRLAISSVNWDRIVEYLGQRWTLVWLALVGSTVLYTTPAGRHGLKVAAIWFLATIVTFLMWSPLWGHYLLFLTFPLVVVAGGGLATVGGRIVGGHRLTWWRVALAALMLVSTAVFVVERCGKSLPRRPAGGPEWSQDRLAARAFLGSGYI